VDSYSTAEVENLGGRYWDLTELFANYLALLGCFSGGDLFVRFIPGRKNSG